MAQSYAFSYRERQTKKRGVVYDVIFRIVDENGYEKQKSLCGYASKTLAKQAYTEFMSTYIAPPKKYDHKSKLIFEFARDNYFGAIKSTIKESSLYNKISIFKNHITPYFTEKDLSTIKAEDIFAWHDIIMAKTTSSGRLFSKNQIKKINETFVAFANWCVKRYGIKNFIENIEMPSRREQKREYTIWTKEQFGQFCSVIDEPRYKAIFYTLFYSGIRCGEMQALTPNEFDGSNLIIKATYTRKTLDRTPYKITQTKNYKIHKVPLPVHAQAVLKEWFAYKKDNKLPNAFIFGGDNPISNNAVQNALDKYTRIAGLPRIRIHDFRHSYVSMLLSNGTNFAVIASLIGDTIEQVVKTYSHLINEDLVKAVNLL